MPEHRDSQQNNKVRPPVVVVLGHVDHGKTTLLDVLRKTKVVAGESGGITQHIGAYQVTLTDTDKKQTNSDNVSTSQFPVSESARVITFLDTPGHEAFTAIRSRGAKVADIAVLVIAAEESVKPQTKEAIEIIQKENMPFIVAINKIDKEGANPQKVKQDLANENVLVEDWGGKVPIVEISAKNNKNIDGLLDMILLVAELEELKEDTSPPTRGVIIESHLDKRIGYVATVLVQKGILKVGDWVVVSNIIGKIKAMEDFMGKDISEAVPSQPTIITGWQDSPSVGGELLAVGSKEEAEAISSKNSENAPLFKPVHGSENNTVKFLHLILKTDVSGSLEAVENSLNSIKSDEIGWKVITYDVGNVNEGDIKMAGGSGARIVGFRVGVEDSARKLAERDGIRIAIFDVIYELVEFIRKEMSDLLDPEVKRNDLGKLKILAVFKNEPKSQIVGGKVTKGVIKRGALTDVMRNNAKLTGGKITQLQHDKEDVQEVKEGLECGLKFERFPYEKDWDIKEGDTLEIYSEEKIPRSL